MARRPSKGKKINPHFWVFCEGETEEEYIGFLRQKYRISSVEIVSKVSGSSISGDFIRKCKRGKFVQKKDVDFLVYDADVPEVLERLQRIDGACLITSNPSIELWFLLHYKDQKSSISTEQCIKELSVRNKNSYKKGALDEPLKAKLKESLEDAKVRAKKQHYPENPSSNMYNFIEALEKAKEGTVS